ncbi:MAG: ABC transporter ATP-binding protein, partial [Planctomycetales bacterium]
KELGRVESLLRVKDVTQIQARSLSEEAQAEIKEVIERHDGELLQMSNPTSTLEELFLKIVRESDERPGRRVVREDAKQQE